jgi:hypothetical protein
MDLKALGRGVYGRTLRGRTHKAIAANPRTYRFGRFQEEAIGDYEEGASDLNGHISTYSRYQSCSCMPPGPHRTSKAARSAPWNSKTSSSSRSPCSGF